MGILSDAFIATDAELEATQFEGSDAPAGFFPTVQGKNMDPVMLACLEAVVTGQDRDRITIGEPIRGMDDRSEEWIYPFSGALVARLVALTEAEINDYGLRWASIVSEEQRNLKLHPPDPSNYAYFADYLQELCQLALRGQAEGKQLYMWLSL